MKNHEWVDDRLLQTNKKYSQLKLVQKEKIQQWMYEAYRARFLESGRYLDAKEADVFLEAVMQQIEEHGIWISYEEICKHYLSCVIKLRKRLKKENSGQLEAVNTIEPLDIPFSVCKVNDYSAIDIEQPFVFTGRTDEEKSLACPTRLVPDNTISREDEWRAFRIFVISAYNTDYVLVKKNDYAKALAVLKSSQYQIKY
jgi:hypothetical protein